MSPRPNRDLPPAPLSWLDVVGVILIVVFVVLSFSRVGVLRSDQSRAAQPQDRHGAY